MVAPRYKQKCFRCRKNWVVVTWKIRYALCYDCQKGDIDKEVKDPKMKKLFDLPEELYKENSFLRNIKSSYLRYGKLTEKQIEAFKKVVEQIKDSKKDSKE